jgi:formylglycine-generating enzyme required for sulfatase activity/tRNA A-37 threonylcarbamoyl transferase component Bud32
MHPEILSLAVDLPPALRLRFDALVARLLSGSLTPTLGDTNSIELPEPEGFDTRIIGERLPHAPEALPEAIPPRYQDVGLLGVGGMGEVRRVRDRGLGRTCAYKVIRPELLGRANVVARFIEEAQIGAQLQHPNIPPVYEGGRLADGRPWFTMKEIRGRTFGDQIRETHAGEVTEAALRRLCGVLASVCDAVGYAHGRGVVHRDLKPDNVMVGSYGEVYVLDWGLAKVVGRPDLALEATESEVVTERSADRTMRTRAGGVMGTPAYMPPEQARGQVGLLDARADVYAVGAMLYEVLSGRTPYVGDAHAVLQQLLAGPPAPLGRGPSATATFTFHSLEDVGAPGPALPGELVSLCMVCLSRDPSDRPSDGAVVGAALRAWLDGSGKRAKALEVVSEADALVAEAANLRTRVLALRAEGDALLAPVAPWAPEEAKAAGWASQDEAARVERQATLLELQREALLRGALTHAPDLSEAHSALVELELARHEAAESARDPDGAARAEVRLREHTDALPERHPTRVNAGSYLKGDGALSLATDVPGAEVLLSRYQLRNRRMVEVPVRSLGPTPIRAVPLPMGSYLCRIRHPGRAEVRYPVHLGRGEHWDVVPPGARDPLPIRLPREGELGPDDCLVPAGWFWSGGDPEAMESLPRRRLWCDELVVKRFPVTNREYVAFLNGLVAMGREAEAETHQPRERSAGKGARVYGRDPSGQFGLRPDADGDLWDPEHPVLLVDWFGASAYAAWLAQTTGRPWRLLGELEWEKSARGVDGRYYPWGDVFDPSWACVQASTPGRALPSVVDRYPTDVSVYGVRGLGGNVQDWCADVFRREGPPVPGARVMSPSEQDLADATSPRCHRGAFWYGSSRVRSASRLRSGPAGRYESLGLRVAFPPGATPEPD